MGDHGEHGGTLLVAGEAAVGELRRFHTVAAASPVSSRWPVGSSDPRAPLVSD